MAAEVTLTNTGQRTAYEVVQAYVTDVVTSVTWAAKELKAFRRVTVPAGASVTTRIEVPAAACSIVDAAGRRVVEPGEFELPGRTELARRRPAPVDVHDHGAADAGALGVRAASGMTRPAALAS